MALSSEDFLSGNEFEAISATFCCYDYGDYSSELVEIMATD